MQKDIHPTFYKDAKVTCACGAVHKIPGTQKALSVEICSECHPHYTGKVKVVDTAGRIDKFKARQAAAAQSQKK